MTEYEAYQLAIAALELGHIHGESVLEQMRFWVGVSYALLALTIVAPQRLTVGATALVLVLYLLFTAFSLINMRSDLAAGMAGAEDAAAILAKKQLPLKSLEKKLSDAEESQTVAKASLIFIPGLFLGTIGYLLISARREYKARRSDSS